MKFLNDILSREPSCKRLFSAVKRGALPLAATGLSQIHKAAVLSALCEEGKKKLLVITHDEGAASALAGDLSELGVNTAVLPSRDYNLARVSSCSKEYEHKRIDTLSSLLDGDFRVVVAAVDSCIQYTLPRSVLENARFDICMNNALPLTELCERLSSAGYVRSEITEGGGQYSVRGGIVDVFPTGRKNPVRIEYWGDDIDGISEFDVETQRRTDTLDTVSIYPACELPFKASALCEKLSDYLKKSRSLSEKQREYIRGDIDALENGLPVNPDLYLPLIYDKAGTVFEYCDDAVVAVCESGNISERLKSLEIQHSEDVKNLLEEGVLSKKTASLWLGRGELEGFLSRALFLENFPRAHYGQPIKELINFDFKRSTPWSGDVSLLCEDIAYMREKKGCIVILAGEQRAAGVLCEELNERDIPAVFLENYETIPERGVYICCGGLSSGFELPSINFLLITHRHVTAEVKRRRARPKNSKEIGSLDELRRGDYVVHTAHGIGVFDGINRITNAGVTKDYIKIKYSGSDILYVPVTQLDLVSKYIGASVEGGIKLNKLGGSDWQKTRKRVKAAVRDMAKQLTALYAKRMSTKGYAFSKDTDLQNNFERRFEYDETDDQLRCINEIKGDMERPVPMDRLLCGDVGFGKTEVALRAAFKCISEGKQCALLVPTTILAMQHYNTAVRRFGDLPVTVKLLNRFVSPREQQKTVTGLRNGSVDMVIGTHRLISKDVAFKDIGLVIIDEEQRFGVAQKERLKELYPSVDVLTLSATPIPRTLNMAMSGLRDMSSIDEAPGDRHPVQTYVMEQNTGVLCDAISRELRRSGQVYYLHNRIETIEICAARLKERLPEARFGIAHGRMTEDELSEVWRQLVEHEIDILVCTTIIETGVDVPNVNTLIIENADRMGLSQLHQLRGRVGRSPRRAYAYFCFTRGKELSEVAAKRLEAIREFTEFGSGFKIAMRDLEIRGAGSILGGEQHGNMEAVGYDMYLKLLADAVNAEKGIETHEEAACTVDLNVSAHIPESYIESLSARLGIYKRIADIKTEEDVFDVTDELCDRFGDPPAAVMGLIDIALLRNKAAAAGITEITGTSGSAVLHITQIENSVAAKLADAFGTRFTLATSGDPAYVIRLEKGEKTADFVSKLSKVL